MRLAVLLALSLVLAASASAQPAQRVQHSITAGEVGVVLRELGLRFERLTDVQGEPLLQIDIGPGVALFFYECERRACRSLGLYTALPGKRPPSLHEVNAWNYEARFTRAYLDEAGVPVLESDLDLAGGVTRGAVAEFIRTYLGALVGFLGFLDDVQEPR